MWLADESRGDAAYVRRILDECNAAMVERGKGPMFGIGGLLHALGLSASMEFDSQVQAMPALRGIVKTTDHMRSPEA